MSANRFISEVLIAVRRNWIVLAVCVITAIVTAVMLNLGASTTYEGRAVIAVDVTTVAQNARLPKPDGIIERTQTDQFYEKVAAAQGIETGTVRDGINVFALGNPQDRIVVTFASTDRSEAEAITRSGALAAVDEGYHMAEPVIGHQRVLIGDAEETLDTLEPLITETPALRFNVWSVRRNLYSDRQILGFMETMLTYDEGVSISESSRESALVQSGIGGLLVGLAIAALLIAVREVRRRSRA